MEKKTKDLWLKLYETADKIKQLKPWMKIYDNELFLYLDVSTKKNVLLQCDGK